MSTVFLFKRGRRERLGSETTFPSEFFYGFVELGEQNKKVDLVDETDLGILPRAPLFWRVLTPITTRAFGFNPYALWHLLKNRKLFSKATDIIATTNALGLALGVLKRFGLIRPNVLFLAMGLLETNPHFIKRLFLKHVLSSIDLCVISRGEQAQLQSVFGFPNPPAYIPFGVDKSFWNAKQQDQKETEASEDYVLSIGNDRYRDYETLIAAWKPEYPKLKIITRLNLPTLPDNVEAIQGDWRNQYLSDAEIRELYQQARFVVLPIRHTAQPSGQSACLQAMSCAKAVLFSDIEGLWDRDIMKSGENCILIPPQTPSAISDAVEALLSQPKTVAEIGKKAQFSIEHHLNTEEMAASLSTRVHV